MGFNVPIVKSIQTKSVCVSNVQIIRIGFGVTTLNAIHTKQANKRTKLYKNKYLVLVPGKQYVSKAISLFLLLNTIDTLLYFMSRALPT